MRLERIVAGTDFSPESEIAVEQALSIARHAGAELVLVHARTVVETTELPGRLSTSYGAIAEQNQAHAREQLARIRERYSGQGVAVSHVLVDGYADTALEQAAGELGAQMIAVGTHGRTGVKRFFLGSVAEKVVRISARDVLVARPARTDRDGPPRLLVPTDFSSTAERAVERAAWLAPAGATIDLLHCRQRPMPVGDLYYPVNDSTLIDIDAELAAAAEIQARKLMSTFEREGVTMRYESVLMPAAEAITERAAGYDLVVIGSHGRRGLRRFLLGSVAETVVRHAPCSVLVAR